MVLLRTNCASSHGQSMGKVTETVTLFIVCPLWIYYASNNVRTNFASNFCALKGHPFKAQDSISVCSLLHMHAICHAPIGHGNGDQVVTEARAATGDPTALTALRMCTGSVRAAEYYARGNKVLKYPPINRLEMLLVGLFVGVKAVSHMATTVRVDAALTAALQ
jgi:hypothetical protein